MPTHEVHPDPCFSLLLSLPRELRDRVYTYALVSNTPFLWPGAVSQSAYSKHRHVSVNLLRTNRQVHDEAVIVLYAQNKFLFTHPSDCNIFRVVTSPASANITSVYVRIKDKDLPLWTQYMGSKKAERSLRSDLPKLKSLWVFLKLGMCPHFMSGVLAGIQRPMLGPQPAGHLPAIQNTVGHQIHTLQQHVQNAINQVMTTTGVQIVGGTGGHAHTPANANQVPPPPPPAPAMPFPQFMQGALGMGGQAQHHQQAMPAPHAHGQHNHPPNPSPLAQHLQAQQDNPTVQVIHPPAQQTPPPTTPTNSTDANKLYSGMIRSNRFKVVTSLCLQLHDVLHTKPPPSALSPVSSTSITPTESFGTRLRQISQHRLVALDRPWTDPTTGASATSGNPSRSPSDSKSSLQTTKTETLPPPPNTEIKIVTIVRPGKRFVKRLLETFPDELEVDPVTKDARTRFRKMHGVDVSWEFNGLSDVEASSAGGVVVPWDGGW
ncbi:uncharacterized protein J4E79_007621 [Alternaria viburni]|uniref:uncharacterized protein n=1 Tax=Alternaria viburni TaxID=566460 RepID=UPI0020C54533|nr:uncharacterized protein J4E79_007621 [Alternaria viburni]KAI4657006.1 hypothetical protein J4E79_007621 [Alternaria viburni]